MIPLRQPKFPESKQSKQNITFGLSHEEIMLLKLRYEEANGTYPVTRESVISAHPQLHRPNITFGISTDGEIFVNVGGTQYTPDANFYKQIAHQTAILAHQVVDLDKENMNLKMEVQQLKDKIKSTECGKGQVIEAVNDALSSFGLVIVDSGLVYIPDLGEDA